MAAHESIAARRSNNRDLAPINTSVNKDYLFPPQVSDAPGSSGKSSSISGSTSADQSHSKPLRSKSSILNLFSRAKPKNTEIYDEPNPHTLKHSASADRLSRPGSSYSRYTSASYVDISSTYGSYTDGPGPRRLQSRRSSKRLRSSRVPLVDQPITLAFAPPPLFQAYPQSIKTIQLEIPQKARGVEDSYYKQDRVKDGLGARLFGFGRHRHKTLNTYAPEEDKRSYRGYVWMPKIYMLVTSGRLLQYSADGPSDRLPEKILKLHKDSAAFASDLMPGRHWVLQVLATAKDYEIPSLEDQKSFLSKLGLEGRMSRKMTSNVLMAFQDPTDMEDWLMAIRVEIEKLGGKKSRPSLSRGREEDESDPISPSHRFMLVESKSNLALPLTSPIRSTPTSPTVVPSEYEGSATVIGSLSERSGSVLADSDSPGAQHELTKRSSIIASRSHPSYAESPHTSRGTQFWYDGSEQFAPEPTKRVSPDSFNGVPQSAWSQAGQRQRQRGYTAHSDIVGRRKSVQTYSPTQNDFNGLMNPGPTTLKRHSTYNDRGYYQPGNRIRASPSFSNGTRPSADAIRRRNSGLAHYDSALLRSTQYRSDPALNHSVMRPQSFHPPPRPRAATFNDHGPLLEDQVAIPPLPKMPNKWDYNISDAKSRRGQKPPSKRLSMPSPVDNSYPPDSEGLDAMPHPTIVRVGSSEDTEALSFPKRTSSLDPLKHANQKNTLRRPASVQVHADSAPFMSSARSIPEIGQGNTMAKRPMSTVEPLPRPTARRPELRHRTSATYIGMAPPGPPPSSPLPSLPASGVVVG